MKFIKNALFHPSAEELENPKLIKTIHWLINSLTLLLWSAGLGVVSLYFARVTYGIELFYSYFQNPLIILLNVLPVIIITAVFWLLSNRVFVGILGSSIVTLLLTFVNYYKLLIRGDPLLATDVYVIAEGISAGSKYTFNVGPAIILVLIATVAAILFSALLLKARLPKRPRFIALALVILSGSCLFATTYHSYGVYLSTENLDVTMEGRALSQWSEKDQYTSRGFIYPFIYSSRNLSSGKPEGYKKEALKTEVSALTSYDIPEAQKVSVISVMLEAYNDFSDLGVEFETDPYEFLHKLQEESISGKLVTNVFAGNTVDTERGFLTGSTFLEELRVSRDSFVRYFAGQGYYTEFCHPSYEWFYNRINAMDYLGFQRSYFFENRYTLPEGYGHLTDEYFFPDIIALYEQTAARGVPYFNFSLTYQNHGPYDDNRCYYDEVYVPRTESISEAGYNILNNYFGGIKSTNDALEGFVEYFKGLEKPVVLIFFGDHNPWLGDGGYVYDEIGVDFSGDEGFYRYYSTPYIIWANDAAKSALGADFVGKGESVSPCFLMSLFFDEAGWQGDYFMQLNRQLRETAPIINTATSKILENGKLTAEHSPEARAQIDKYHLFEYYRRRDADLSPNSSP